MKRINWVLSLVLLLALGLIACGGSTPTTVPTTAPTTAAVATVPPNTPFSVSDSTGATVALAKKAERIACISTDCIEVLAGLGVEPIAISQISEFASHPRYFAAKAKNFTVLKTSGGQPNLEELAQAKPDLTIISNYQVSGIPAIKKISPVYVLATEKYTLDDTRQNFRNIAKLTGTDTKAEAVIKAFEDKLAMYKAKAPAKPLSFISRNSVDINAYSMTNKSSLCQLLMGLANCALQAQSGVPDFGGYQQISLEKVLQVDPEAIFMLAYTDIANNPKQDEARKELQNNPFWKELKAVKNNKVFEVDVQVWNGAQLNSWGFQLDDLLTKLYPETFPKPLNS
jgi:iron complex transport system substrate-binding protein